MSGNNWQRADVVEPFLKVRRELVPHGGDQLQMLFHLVEHFAPTPRHIADLGCGSGVLAQALLERYPEASSLLLDYSEPMLEAAREAMRPWGSCCEIIRADLNASLLDWMPAGGTDLVVSGYAIHHLTHSRKRSLYAEVHEVLCPGGLFVNLEHVASASPTGEALFNSLFIDHLTGLGNKPRSEVEHGYHHRPDGEDNILALVETQVDWLREIGFENADCYFKWLELAVFAGTKAR